MNDSESTSAQAIANLCFSWCRHWLNAAGRVTAMLGWRPMPVGVFLTTIWPNCFLSFAVICSPQFQEGGVAAATFQWFYSGRHILVCRSQWTCPHKQGCLTRSSCSMAEGSRLVRCGSKTGGPGRSARSNTTWYDQLPPRPATASGKVERVDAAAEPH